MRVLELCGASQSGVNREHRRGLGSHPWGAPMLLAEYLALTLRTFTGLYIHTIYTLTHTTLSLPHKSPICIAAWRCLVVEGAVNCLRYRRSANTGLVKAQCPTFLQQQKRVQEDPDAVAPSAPLLPVAMLTHSNHTYVHTQTEITHTHMTTQHKQTYTRTHTHTHFCTHHLLLLLCFLFYSYYYLFGCLVTLPCLHVHIYR